MEIGAVESSLTAGELQLTDVEIADPRDPMRNLLQADVASIKLDPRRLFHREFVIDEGRMTGVQFGTPRTESGEIARNRLQNTQTTLSNKVKEQLVQFSQSWLDQFQLRIQNTLDDNLETLQVARQIREFWPNEFQQHRTRALELQARVRSLKEIIKTPPRNPLRDGQRIAQAISDLDAVRKQIVTAHEELQTLSTRAISDQNALLAARDRDEAKIKQLVKIGQVNSQAATELLLGEKQSQYLNEMLGWIKWVRETVPNPETDFVPQRQLGTRIQFAGIQKRPGLVIRKLHLDGCGHFAGQHYQFVGQANDISSAPNLHQQPTTIALNAKGNQQVHVHATVDRRSKTRIDDLTIHCPSIAVGHQLLGDEKALLLNMEPSDLSAEIQVRLEDDKLQGQLVFHHSNVKLNVEKLHRLAGGQMVADSINDELASVEDFQILIDLGGTLKVPTATLTSDLGDKISLAMNSAFHRTAQRTIEQHSVRLQEILDNELDDLRREINNNSNEILAILRNEVDHVSQLQSDLPMLNSWTPIR